MTDSIARLIDFRPHVVLSGEDIATLRLRTFLPATVFIHTRHGLASKGITYRSVTATDYACVTSPFTRRWYEDADAYPRRDFWEVGYVQMDSLFKPESVPLPFDVPSGRKVILYAPTFQGSLSSAAMLGERCVELLRGNRRDVVVIIKPHPLIPDYFPQWMDWWREAARLHPDVFLVDKTHTDVMLFLKAADVLVSDASSVLLEFLALNRPMILITNSRRESEPYFDPNGLEWRWRDMGQEILDVNQLPQAIDRALDEPSLGEAQRLHYRQLLFGSLTDGCAAERIAANVNALDGEVSSAGKLAVGWLWGKIAFGGYRLKRRMHA